MSRARLSPAEIRRATAAGRIETTRANLELLEADGVPEDDERVVAAHARLAEALAEAGRFQEAAGEAPTEELKSEYISVHAAIERDDEEVCDCPKVVNDPRGPNGQTVELPTSYVERLVYSEKHQRDMPVIRCTLCGDLQVARLTGALARIERAHAESTAKALETTPVRVRRQN